MYLTYLVGLNCSKSGAELIGRMYQHIEHNSMEKGNSLVRLGLSWDITIL